VAFVKGISGNPGGRPKIPTPVLDLCRAYITESGCRQLIEIAKAKSTPTKLRIIVIRELWDRGFGKAPLVMAGAGGLGPSELVIRWVNEVAAQVEKSDDIAVEALPFSEAGNCNRLPPASSV
jgi:hypothetical protein